MLKLFVPFLCLLTKPTGDDLAFLVIQDIEQNIGGNLLFDCAVILLHACIGLLEEIVDNGVVDAYEILAAYLCRQFHHGSGWEIFW